MLFIMLKNKNRIKKKKWSKYFVAMNYSNLLKLLRQKTSPPKEMGGGSVTLNLYNSIIRKVLIHTPTTHPQK